MDGNVIKTLNTAIEIQEDCLRIANISGADPTAIKYEELRAVSLDARGLFRRERFVLARKTGEEHIFFINKKERDEYVKLRRDLHKHAKIGIYEEGKYRTEISPASSFYNLLTFIIVLPIVAGLFFSGIWLCTLGLGAAMAGVPLSALGAGGFLALYRLVFGAIEGTCPICLKKITASKYSKRLTCLSCLNIIHIRLDYFEVEVKPRPPDGPAPADNDDDYDYYDYRV
ncbi:MAG: hypothetical protein LBS62_10725 [Clostridiales bacterium]|jgi:hypothetical protein|nr:hypothetical protein [Clostridiales bacterium]